MYIIGAYFNKYGFIFSAKKALLLGTLSLTAEMISIPLMGMAGEPTYYVWPCAKTLPVITSILFFQVFSKINISNPFMKKAVTFIAPTCFGIYLFHIGDMNKLIFTEIFNNSRTYYNKTLFLQLIVCMFSVFSFGVIFDKLRIAILEKNFMRLIKKLTDQLDKKTKKYFD